MSHLTEYEGRIRRLDNDPYTLPISVTLDDITEQRNHRWLDFHPEDFCHRCGRRNVSWWTDSEDWNAVMRTPDGDLWDIVCPPCFIQLAENLWGEQSWHLSRDDAGTERLRRNSYRL